ncbi:uncharacterized protein LOC111697807 [Eurytemora carolleeae]|uniref:uncharacterized protein LOC111697807 n=1 Tax=Eurytemora carolleeae TaxID=1294199 RepID=UPI000C760407|nr:uncharacterized protein LOC111697807 [Eurytemora carolleeae]|eukprot:XP_023323706.1 uncharacterized protein LOC111697807 [Eurytemora affinis]
MNLTTEESGDRRFYELPVQSSRVQVVELKKKQELAEYINSNIIGKDATFISPFGRRKIVECDYTASGKSLTFIEDYLKEEVLPLYGNTHTTTTVSSLQTTLFRHEARDIIRNAVHAGETDAVIFEGSGCTGAVHKLVNAIRDFRETVVFVGPHEHHSNILPWKEAGAETVIIHSNEYGCVDLLDLEEKLKMHNEFNLIGCFSICSNVSGVLEDDLSITALLHKYGALAFWDYASAAPYVHIDMNPQVPEDVNGLCYKDAIYFSMHKFIGGVQTPGVLVAKKHVFRNPVPSIPGGGTVFFVSEEHARYLQDIEVREEGGTPYIVESIRAGLVMKLKESVGSSFIMEQEHQLRRRALQTWSSIPNLAILGPNPTNQVPIFSFLIKHPESGLFLHYNFVVALLNDLFGIQARGGCACAGPYMQSLLGLDKKQTRQYENILLEDSRLDRVGLRRGHMEHSQWEILRPGATRLNLSWFSSQLENQFVIDAVKLVAEEGWKLLPLYRFNNETGDWYHSGNTKFKDRRWLGHITFKNGRMEQIGVNLPQKSDPPTSLMDCIHKAKEILDSSPHLASREVVPDQTKVFPAEVNSLRWFVTPFEAKCALLTPLELVPTSCPFTPIRFLQADGTTGFGSHQGTLVLQSKDLERILSNSSNKFKPWTLEARKPVKSKQNGGTNHVEYSDLNSCLLPNDTISAEITQEERIEVGEDALKKELENSGISVTTCNDGTCILPGGKRDTEIPKLKPKTACWKPPSKDIFKPFLEAVTEFDMIKDGDKVLVGVSGGKDSLSLLHTLRQYIFYAGKNGINFSIGAVTVDPMSSGYDPRPLIPYMEQLGIEYLFEEQDIMTQALEVEASSICAFCSRMKRGRLYAAARRAGYNVLALGQHLDDLSESFFMSLFHNGRLRTMKANYTNSEGDLRIIRPFVYVRENLLRHFAESEKLPIIAENCPACFEAPKERQRIKQLLAQQELLFPRLYWNLKTALYPVMRIHKTGLESAIFGKSADISAAIDEDDIE